MAMEALSSNEIFNVILYDTINSSSSFLNFSSQNSFLLENHPPPPIISDGSPPKAAVPENPPEVQGRKKRRRRVSTRVCKNKEEAETQRMTHIAVERNRRKIMNEHLAVLRSLMPESYVERGDQASIVGGAITFVKKLEHILQSLEATKGLQLQNPKSGSGSSTGTDCGDVGGASERIQAPFSQFFAYPQYNFCPPIHTNKYTRSCKQNGGVADIEVTLIETHASIRALCQRRLRQLSKLVSGFYSIYLTILHLNVTTLEPLVLYSISAKVEEGCQLKSADEIAEAVHQLLKLIEDEAITPPPPNYNY